MTQSPDPNWPQAAADDDAFIALVDRFLSPDATVEDAAALNTELRNNPARLALFAALSVEAQHLLDKHQPAEVKAEPEETTPESFPIYRKGYEPQPFKLRPRHFALAAATLLIAGLAVGLYSAVAYYQHQVELEKEQAAIAAARDAQPVATLIQRTGNLTTPSGYPSDGRDYPRGEYALSSGSAEFMLTNAVNVKLRGETRMTMRNNMNVTLTRGTAEFVCPEGTKGFTVHLPDDSKIVDLGTAFEVELGDTSGPLVRVTNGSVEWTPPVPDADPVLITAGQTAWVDDDQIRIASIIVPVAATASSVAREGLDPTHVIDGSGLLTPQAPFSLHTAGNERGTMWRSSNKVDSAIGAWIQFDLGREMDITGAYLWNYNADNTQQRGFLKYDVWVADSSGELYLLTDDATIDRYPQGAGTPNGPEFSAFTASGIRFIRFVSESQSTNDVIGLSEVRFEGTPSATRSDADTTLQSEQSDPAPPPTSHPQSVGETTITE